MDSITPVIFMFLGPSLVVSILRWIVMGTQINFIFLYNSALLRIECTNRSVIPCGKQTCLAIMLSCPIFFRSISSVQRKFQHSSVAPRDFSHTSLLIMQYPKSHVKLVQFNILEFLFWSPVTHTLSFIVWNKISAWMSLSFISRLSIR